MINELFSERQKSVIAVMLTTISLVVMVGIVLWLATLTLSFFTYFSGVFLPLALAAILATLMKPYYEWLRGRIKSTGLSVALVILSLIIPLGIASYYFGVMLLGQLNDFLNQLPVWADRIQAFVEVRLPILRAWMERNEIREKLMEFIQGRSGVLASSAAAIGQGVFSTGAAFFRSVAGLLGWLVVPIYFAYLIQAPTISGKTMESALPFLRPETRQNVVYLATEFVNILVSFFRGQLLIAICQGLIFATGFGWVGLQNGVVIGLTLGLLNIVPYLGNLIGLAVVIPLAWFQPGGGSTMLLQIAAVFAVVQVTENYVLTPRIMGKSTGLHPMAIIFALLFWGTAFGGLLGMILAIPLTAFLVVFWRLLKTRYIKEWL